ncbi:MAG TPA: glycosyltransferase, partial [Polyangiales bacterium]
ALRREIAARGLAPRFRFFGETSRIHALLAAADIVALPSVDLYAKMDYPLVLLEAMSLGRAVVVARGSAAEELAADDAARAVEASPDALASEFTRLLADDADRLQLGARARERVMMRYGHMSMAAAYEALYDELL